MDAKEIKSHLKKAREAIRQKGFREALKYCKDVLEIDGKNYMALVLKAVAAEGLEDNEQALTAYKQATQADHTQVLAWQGLCSYYEKHAIPAFRDHHVDVYLKMVEFHSNDQSKKNETVVKLVKLCETLTDRDKLDKVERLVEEYVGQDSSYDEDKECVLKFHLTYLVQNNQLRIPEVSQSLLGRYPGSVCVLKYRLLSVLDQQIQHGDMTIKKEIEMLTSQFQTALTDATCDILRVGLAYCSLVNGDCKTASQQLHQVRNGQLVCSCFLQACSCLRLHQYRDALNHTKTGVGMLERKNLMLTVSSESVRPQFQMMMVRALCNVGDQTSLHTALELLNKELGTETEYKKLLCGQVYYKLEDLEKAKSCLVGESVERQVLEGLILYKQQDYTTAINRFKSALVKEPSSGSHHVNLAKCYWQLQQQLKECFTLLLKAAKLNPHNSETFEYLGHYYSKVGGDATRARKCYQKAFDLDNRNEAAGEQLCDLLKRDGEEEAAHGILLKVSSTCGAGRGKWAWLRLGLYQIKYDDPSVAIASFQAALRLDTKDVHVWECLGEAYLCRGSYTASLKAFNKAVELNPSSIYCLFQMASIKQTLGQLTEAVEEYKAILQQSPNYVPALKGIGQTYVMIAKSLLHRCFHGRARDTAQLAAQYLHRGSQLRPDVACLWKLLGDACTILHVLPDKQFRFKIGDKDELGKMETMKYGNRCYIRALKISPECSSLWHDLGVNYSHQSEASTGNDVILLAEKSAQCLKKAVQLDATNYRHWNSLGVLACQKVYYQPALAQHCFIKSIQVEHNNVVAWTNLAALYLKHDNVKLAHEAFKVAQSLEPSYVSCWIGQAMIAEFVGHEDAMDLYRHTTELSNHIEGSIGYGHWVCSMLLQAEKKGSHVYQYAIEQMSAIPAASDALARYTDRVKTDPVAYNLHALLLERQQLYKTATKQLHLGVEVLETTGIDDAAHRDILSNYARLLRKSGDYVEACKMYERLDRTGCRVEEITEWATAAYKSHNFTQSLSLYSRALEMTSNDLDKSHLLAAVAMCLYQLQDLDASKTALFQSSQLSEVSVYSLLALAALGFLQSDVTLVLAAVQELSKHGGDKVTAYDVTLLRALSFVLEGNVEEIKTHLQSVLHQEPCRGDAWYVLTVVLLQYFLDLYKDATVTARNAILYQHTTDDLTQKFLVPLADIRSGYYGDNKTCREAFCSAQKAVHLYPDRVEGWACLSSAMLQEAVHRSDTESRTALLKQQYTITQYIHTIGEGERLKQWCMMSQVASSVNGNTHDVMEDIDKMMTEYGSSETVGDYFALVRSFLESS